MKKVSLIKEIMQQILIGCLTYPKHRKKVTGRGPLGDRDKVKLPPPTTSIFLILSRILHSVAISHFSQLWVVGFFFPLKITVLFIYLFDHAGSSLLSMGSLSSLWYTGFSLWRLLLLWSTGSRCLGFSSSGCRL